MIALEETVVRLLSKIFGENPKRQKIFEPKLNCKKYNEAWNYAKKHAKIDGVDEAARDLPSIAKKYEKTAEEVVAEFAEKTNASYVLYSKKALLLKRATIARNFSIPALIALSILPGVLNRAGSFGFFIDIVLLTVFTGSFLFVVASLVIAPFLVMFLKKSASKLYDEYLQVQSSAQQAFRQVNNGLDRESTKVWSAVDSLYLATLEPLHRETILNNREQERRHAEQMKLAEEQNRALTDQLTEQSYNTGRLLEIEEERERRYRQSR